MSQTKMRVVSVGDKRAWQRLLNLVQSALSEEGIAPEIVTAATLRVAQQAMEEGLILTRQVAPR